MCGAKALAVTPAGVLRSSTAVALFLSSLRWTPTVIVGVRTVTGAVVVPAGTLIRPELLAK